MGGGKSGGSNSLDFYGTMAGVVCAGPVDELVSFIMDGKLLWPPAKDWAVGESILTNDLRNVYGHVWIALGNHTSSTSNAPPNETYWELWETNNTVKRSIVGDGVYSFTVADANTGKNYGTAYLWWGTDSQTDTTAILSALGHPPYRRQCVLLLEDFYCGTQRETAPDVQVVVRRRPTRQTVVTDTALDADGQANPIAAACELHADPVFGAGLPASRFNATSLQALSTALAADKPRTYLSVVLDSALSLREFWSRLLEYFDGWARFNSAREIEAGTFLHDSAPPAFDTTNTFTADDLVNEPEWQTQDFSEVPTSATVSFTNRDNAYKGAGQTASNGFARLLIGAPRPKKLDRPWILRASQALQHAAEWIKVSCQRAISGAPVLRAEKAAAIQPGDNFLLSGFDDDPDIIARCLGRTIAAPPTGTVTLKFISERGQSPYPVVAEAVSEGFQTTPEIEAISIYQIWLPPTSLLRDAGGGVYLGILVARKVPVTIGCHVWFQGADVSNYQELGLLRHFQLSGALAQGYASTVVDTGSAMKDDTTETLQITPNGDITAKDWTNLNETQTEDMIDDDHLLCVLFNSSTPLTYTGFEICTIREIRLDGGVYKLKVRRGRFGTTIQSFSTGHLAWMGRRSTLDISAFTHSSFESAAANGDTIHLKLQARTPSGDSDLSDASKCPVIDFSFESNPYVPMISWASFEVQTHGAGDFAVLSDFNAIYNPDDVFRFTFDVTCASGNLTDVQLLGRAGRDDIVLWAKSSGMTSVLHRTVEFDLPHEGYWDITIVATNSEGDIRELPITVDGSRKRLKLDTPVGAAEKPMASVLDGGYCPADFPLTVELATDTEYADIKYQIVAGTAAYDDGDWLDYSAALEVPDGSTVYSKAVKTGLDDSEVEAAYFYAAYSASGGGGGGRGCFLPTSPVTMADGTTREIQALQPGDELLAYELPGLGAGAQDWKNLSLPGQPDLVATTTQVKRVLRQRFNAHYLINGRLGATYEHPFLASRDGRCSFLRAAGLRPGDYLFGPAGWEQVMAVSRIVGEIQTVNLVCGPRRVFVVGGWLVHNAVPKGSDEYW